MAKERAICPIHGETSWIQASHDDPITGKNAWTGKKYCLACYDGMMERFCSEVEISEISDEVLEVRTGEQVIID